MSNSSGFRLILVADDVLVNRTLLAHIFSKEYRVIQAGTGMETLRLLRAHPDVAILILDLIMPELDGFDVLREMQSDPQLKDIPVVVATGSNDEQSQIRAFELGAVDVLSKPYNSRILLARARNILDKADRTRLAAERTILMARVEEQNALLRKAQYDALTGLYTREVFYEKAAKMIASRPAGYYTLSCFNVEGFKLINDQYGVDSGDRVLKGLAEIFARGFRPLGGICCRISADMFAMLYPTAYTHSREIAAIHLAAATPDPHTPPITYTIGRYLVNDLSLQVSAMYDRASLAQVSVKGRYTTHVADYTESMRLAILEEQRITQEMAQALADHQFELWLQPQYNHYTGAMVGAEALVRWRHPERGIIPPARFIPLFERNDFIFDLDRYVWESACIFLRRQLDLGRTPPPISVNVSRADICQPDFKDTIPNLVALYNIPRDLFRIEITESAFSTSNEGIIAAVKSFKAQGFIVEIDDFGSGYSSFNTLKDVPADVLKLDMRFLESSEHSQRGGSILEAIIRMTQWLGMSVIAEGVESQAQADFLKSIGCFNVQGYLYAKPMPAREFEALLDAAEVEPRPAPLKPLNTLDTSAFWDPASMETLIFNSYVGGACIFEYRDGQMEILRVNDQYTNALGLSDPSGDNALFSPMDYMTPADRGILIDAIDQATGTAGDVSCDLVLTGLPNRPGRSYFRANMRVIARVENRLLFYCSIINTTVLCEAEQTILERSEQLALLSQVTRDLLAESDADKAIHILLLRLMDYFSGNRAHLFELDDGGSTASNTYEVCADGVASEMDSLQALPAAAFTPWAELFRQNLHVIIDSVSDLGDDRAAERSLLEGRGIHSLVAVALRNNGVFIGFLGVENPRIKRSHLYHLDALGDLATILLTRRDLTRQLKRERDAFVDMMQNTPGGFARMLIRADGAIVPTFLNNTFCSLLNMTQEEAMAIYREDAFAGAHPDDAPGVRQALQEAMDTNRVLSTRVRLCKKGGGYVPMQAYYRAAAGDGGQRCLYGYYADITEQITTAEYLSSIMESVNGGIRAGTIDSSGAFSLHFANDQYYRILGYTRTQYETELDDLSSLLYEEDRDWVLAEMTAPGEVGTTSVLEYRCIRRDGVIVWVRCHTSVCRFTGVPGPVLLGVLDVIDDEVRLRSDLEESKQRLSSVITNIPVGIGVFAVKEGEVCPLYLSNRTCSLFGYTQEEYSGLTSQGLASVRTQFADLLPLTPDGPHEIIRPVVRPDGSTFWLRILAAKTPDEGFGETIYATLADITDRMEREKEERLLSQRYKLLIEMRRIIVLDYDVHSNQVTISVPEKGGTRSTTLSPFLETVGRWNIIAPESQELYQLALWDACAAPKSGTLVYRADFGWGVRWYRSHYISLAGENGKVDRVLSMIEDVNSDHEAHLRLVAKSETDAVTGLMNRASLDELLALRLTPERRSGSDALFMLDLDDFKHINDTAGHQAGDQVLRQFADLLRRTFRASDLICRYGGDEFLIFMPSCGTAEIAREKAALLLSNLSTLPTPCDRPLGCSIGVVLVQSDSAPVELLKNQADYALYVSKTTGKSTYTIFDPKTMSGRFSELDAWRELR